MTQASLELLERLSVSYLFIRRKYQNGAFAKWIDRWQRCAGGNKPGLALVKGIECWAVAEAQCGFTGYGSILGTFNQIA